MSSRTQTSSFGMSKRLGHDASKFYQRKLFDGKRNESQSKANRFWVGYDISSEYCDLTHKRLKTP